MTALPLFLVYLLGAGTGCDVVPERAGSEDKFLIPIASQAAHLELALTIPEKQEGLKNRDSLGEDDGMAFLYQSPQKASFWMKDTFIPLDIGFFTGDGILREVHQMHPHVEVPVRSFRDDIVIAVEMNKGWFQEKAIGPGASIDLQALKTGIRERGEDPESFAIKADQ